MAQPNTQDTQKVFNSATENFKSFVGSVENVSKTKSMEEIYANMTKLFDAFTNGALLKQGANSETLLRTVYRSLNDDFLEIVQDTDSVDKLIEVIKSKQEGIEPDKVDEALVSETTKKVVTKTLDPETCDPMQVVLDFIDELQTSILQVKLNLSREYERRRLEYAKSLAGQQEDLDKLKDESTQQTTEISETLGQVAEDETKWKDEHLNELSKLMEKFDQATGKASDNILAQTLHEDKTLSEIAKDQKKVNWDKLVAGIKGQQKALEELKSKEPPKAETKNQTPGTKGQKNIQTSDEQSKPTKQEKSPIQAEGKVPSKKEDEGKKENGESKNVESKKDATKETPKDQQKEQKKEEIKKQEGKPKEKIPEAKPPKDELSPLVPKISKAGIDATKAGKLKLQPPQKPKDKKLNVKPSKNGMHSCPICGYMHPPGGPHVSPQQQPQPQAPAANDNNGGSKITQNGVLNALGKVHQNIQKQMNNNKFRNGFTMNFPKIQSGLQKQMKKIDKSESTISKDLSKTKRGIRTLKLKAMKPKGPGLLGLLMGGIAPIAFVIIGGLILITLARLALKKWSDTYMPKSDGSTFSIFGIPIPGWDTLKALGLGIWNFITVGLPNYWDRLKFFFGDMKKKLFGKKGIFKDMITTKYNLLKIIGAVIIGHLKKAGGALVSFLLKTIGFVLNIFFPGAGSVLIFLAKFGPMIFSFIMNQIMAIWTGKKASAEKQAQNMAANQMASGKSKVAHFRKILLANARGVKPFKGQLNVIDNLQTSKRGGGKLPTKGAIMRSVPVHHNKNFDNAEKLQENKMEKDKEAAEEDVEKRLKSKKSGDILVNIHNASQEYAKYINDAASESRTWYLGTDTSKISEETKKRGQKFRKKLYDTILPQMKALDRYIMQLNMSKRFKNVKGPLYDPNTGWNPGYRVFASDLRTIIPLKPFEAIHSKPDIYFGKPAEAEADSIGFMPFTWIQDGAKISVHPLNYELARAQAIRSIYEKYLMGWDLSWTASAKGVDTKDYAKYWTEWNSALVSHKIGGYENENDVLFKDRFVRFIKKLRAGQIQGKDNNLDTAKNQAQGFLAETWDDMTSGTKLAATVGVAFAINPAYGAVVAGTILAVKGFQAAKKGVQNMNRIFDYDKGGQDLEYKEGDSWWTRRKKDAKRLARKAQAALTIKEWRGTEASGVKYGDVRDFWLDSGALDLFNNNTIMGTVGAALPLIDFLVGRGIIPKGPNTDKATGMHDLMSWFFGKAGITGYDWNQVIGDEPSQAGFAQVFLEYLKYKVLPQWNNVEQLLSDEITYKTQDTNAKLLKGVVLLNTLMSQKGIFDFMYKHLRFPNMKINIVDYSNANRWEKLLLNKYREQMGIPDAKEKDRILKGLQKVWGQIPNMNDSELKRTETLLRNALRKGEFEARFTGDYTYVKQLKQYWDKLQSTIQARLDAQASGDKIVKKAGDVQTKVLESPPKTLREMEEEKRKQAEEEAKRKAEQEAKEKAEREKKLKEEAKRKEELAIAQAKIKAMEAIRKQEQNYETILSKMINNPGSVTEKELKSLGDEVKNLKQEAENKIANLPREERELKLALIRGDKISEKTFGEIKETAIGLHGNLQEYIEEVNKIPVGSVLAIDNGPGMDNPQPVRMQDSDSVDLGDF